MNLFEPVLTNPHTLRASAVEMVWSGVTSGKQSNDHWINSSHLDPSIITRNQRVGGGGSNQSVPSFSCATELGLSNTPKVMTVVHALKVWKDGSMDGSIKLNTWGLTQHSLQTWHSWTEAECRTSASSASSPRSSGTGRRPRTIHRNTRGCPPFTDWTQGVSGLLRRCRCRWASCRTGWWALQRGSTRAQPGSIPQTSRAFIQTRGSVCT